MNCIKLPKIVNVFVKLISTVFFIMHFNSYAIEPFIQLHKADQSSAYGVSIGLGDNFFKQKEYNWAISYNRVEDVNISWNGDDIDFSLDTVDFMLSYRYYPKTYDRFLKSLIFEFQAGLGITLTENKFLWPALEEEKFFSEQGDVNALLAFLVHKKFTKEVSMHIGIKSYPSYAEFGDISSIFLGFSYQFGSQDGY